MIANATDFNVWRNH